MSNEFVFKLPDVGEGTAEAEIADWHIKVGDLIKEDQPMVDVLTDKTQLEITSPVSGVVLSIHAEIGGRAAVGSPLVIIRLHDALSPAPAPASLIASTAIESSEFSKQAAAPQLGSQPEPTPTKPVHSKPLASPAVRDRASQLGVSLEAVSGTGPMGRIGHADLDRHIANSAPVARTSGTAPARQKGVEDVQIIGLRRKIAERMQDAKRRIPHITYVEEFDLTELDDLRLHLNGRKGADQPKLTLLPFFMLALAQVLPAHPQINARYDDDAGVLHRYEALHLGIATQTRTGLLVPVVRNVENRDLWNCAAEIARVAETARAGRASREELSGSTLTITSMGALGGVSATHVINSPEVAILGPNRLVERPVVRGGQVVVRKIMNLSSSFDHRIIDGYEAAEFVQHLRGMLEHPATLVMDGK